MSAVNAGFSGGMERGKAGYHRFNNVGFNITAPALNKALRIYIERL